jgi:vacuolar-type H+-ATPase subunit C/Vma6
VQVDRYVLRRLRNARVPRVAESAKEEFVERLADLLNIKNVLRGKISGLDAERCKKLFTCEGREISEWKFNDLCILRDVEEVISSLQGTSYHEYIREGYEHYSKSGNVQLLEIGIDRSLLKTVNDLSVKNYPFLGPLIRFIMSRYYEVRNLKVISKGVAEGLPKDRIKPLLIIGG